MRVAVLIAFFFTLALSAFAQSGPPALCKPCLFYGGDYDQNDVNSASLDDENTLAFPDTSTYGALRVPGNHIILVEGILFQLQFDGTVKLDPNGVTWEIRKGVSEGNGGTVVASGQGFAEMQPTGRGGNGPEYTTAVKVNPPVTLNAGSYWFNITPPCLGKNDPPCASNQYGVSNTTHRTNSYRGIFQIPSQIFINSQHFMYNWRNWCDFIDGYACASLSFGLMGKVVQ
jgi:hypothetical protein